MHKAKLTSKGQITIPAAVREQLNIGPGDKIVFLPCEAGEFRIRRVGSVKELFGAIHYSGPPASVEEMDQAIAEHAAKMDETSKTTPKKKLRDGTAA